MHLVTDVHRCIQADGKALIRPLRAGEGGESCAGTDNSQLLLCARNEGHSFIQHPTVFPSGLLHTRHSGRCNDSLVRQWTWPLVLEIPVPTNQQQWEQHFQVGRISKIIL